MSQRRKALGGFGEKALDVRLGKEGWEAVASNRRFRGGEIDRVYAHGGRMGRSYLVAEVKTLAVKECVHLESLLGGDFLRSALRPRQCRNLRLWGRLLGWGGAVKVYLRVFRIFAFPDAARCDAAEVTLRARGPGAGKVLRVGETTVALSLSPEFVPRGQATSPLQIEWVW